MCGIAGILRLDAPILAPTTDLHLRAAGRALAHRGPDDEQMWQDGPVGLVIRRLAIVDVDGGAQPLFNEDGSLVLVFNGEIYNAPELRNQLRHRHQFRTRSDGEVILHLYEDLGLDFVDELNGMFAIALWDRRQQRLVLTRDRLGVKPIFYHLSPDRLIFGSEIKSLLHWPDCPREFDWVAALDWPTRSSAAVSSYFHGIEYLPGGHMLVADARSGSTQVRKYWTLTRPTDDEYRADARSESEMVEGYRALLEDAVRLNLRSDVEFGLFLSGGIDSVAIAALAAREQSFHTFTVLSQSTFTNGDAGSAHEAAQHFGLANHQVLFDWHKGFCSPAQWKRLLWITELPSCDAEQLYKFSLHQFAKAVRPGVKVMLTGQGSDEFNGGYSDTWTDDVTSGAEPTWNGFMATLASLERRRFAHPSLSPVDATLGPAPLLRRSFLADVAGRELHDDPWMFHAQFNALTLQIYNLWHEDRTAAGNSIENRVPYLDHRLVDYCLRIPPASRERLFWRKRILREAAPKGIPDALRYRPKVPFFVGPDLRYTNRMLYGMLMQDGQALIREAFGDDLDDHPVIGGAELAELIAQVPRDPEHRKVETLLLLVNGALLEKMAASEAARVTAPFALAPEVHIADWKEEEPAVGMRLARRRPELDLDAPVAFAPNVYLVRDDSTGVSTPRSYIVVDEAIAFYFDDDESHKWLEVLRRMDGARTLRELAREAELTEAEICKHVDEALDYDLVVLGQLAATGEPRFARGLDRGRP